MTNNERQSLIDDEAKILWDATGPHPVTFNDAHHTLQQLRYRKIAEVSLMRHGKLQPASAVPGMVEAEKLVRCVGHQGEVHLAIGEGSEGRVCARVPKNGEFDKWKPRFTEVIAGILAKKDAERQAAVVENTRKCVEAGERWFRERWPTNCFVEGMVVAIRAVGFSEEKT